MYVQLTTEHLIGSTMVAILAARRFNMPPTNRASTTAFRYHLAQSLYVVALVLLFLVLSHPSSKWLTEYLDASSGAGPMLSALILVALRSDVPPLREVDQWLRDVFQSIAAIPTELDRLADEIGRGESFVPSDRHAAVTNALAAAQLHVQPAWFTHESPFFDLLHATSIWQTIRGEAAQPGPRLARLGVTAEQAHEIDRRLAAVAAQAAGRRDCKGCDTAFARDAARLHAELRRLAAQDVLRFQASQRRREERLVALGFRLQPRPTIPAHQIAGVCLLILLIAGVAFLGKAPAR